MRSEIHVEAIGSGTMAIGFGSKAYGAEGCFATGFYTQSNGNSCTVVGRFNDTLVTRGNSATGSSDSPIFIIGNGDGFTSLSNAMVVRKNGKVGLGVNSPAYRIHVKNTEGSAVIGLGASEGRTGMAFRANGTEVGSLTWRLDEQQFVFSHGSLVIFRAVGGKMGIGRTPQTNNLEVNGSASKEVAGNWIANSDRRIKMDIQSVENGLATLMKLRPVTFKYSPEWLRRHPNIKDQHYYNFVAQEYAEVFPESVQGSGEYLDNSDQEILQIDTYNAQIVNIRATQELAEKIQILEKENSSLRTMLDDLRREFNHLQAQLND